MSENTTEVLVGGVVLAAALGFVIYAGQVTGLSGPSDDYELTANFRAADGLTIGTDVRLAGVKIGRVTELELDPETFRAATRFTVQSDIELPDDSAVSVATEGLLGGTYLELLPGGSPFTLAPGDEIEFTQGSVSLVGLLMKFVSGNDGNSE